MDRLDQTLPRQPLKDLGQQGIGNSVGLRDLPGAGQMVLITGLSAHVLDGNQGVFRLSVKMQHNQPLSLNIRLF